MCQTGNPTTTELLDRFEAVEWTDAACLRLLASTRRRVTLAVLDDGESPFDLRSLAIAVARHEASGDVPSWEHVQRAELSLHHNHLPRLDDHGVLTYESGANRISLDR